MFNDSPPLTHLITGNTYANQDIIKRDFPGATFDQRLKGWRVPAPGRAQKNAVFYLTRKAGCAIREIEE